MARFVNLFISDRHRPLLKVAVWLAFALLTLAASALIWRMHMQTYLHEEAQLSLKRADKLNGDISFAFAELNGSAHGMPCSPQFLRDLHRIAFRPDGLNEFIYAPGGTVLCSTSLHHGRAPVPLGPPDATYTDAGKPARSVWIAERLDVLDMPDVTGHIVLEEPFAIVVPPMLVTPNPVGWADQELVLASASQGALHIGGVPGLYEKAATGAGETSWFDISEVACSAAHPFCVGIQTNLASVAGRLPGQVAIVIVLVGAYAMLLSAYTLKLIDRRWSMEARFLRNLNSSSVTCAYQPILDLETGKISGCEVLARWRDLDGSVISPDTFIDIVSRAGKTLEFTKLVAERAHAELARELPNDARLQVNFNIFPKDLDSAKLSATFSMFEADRGRFTVALEIVESDDLSIEQAQNEIEALARKGMRVYVDDFGTGYSSIHRIAALAIHGVKLDRSFAMAPRDSLMARMLVHAVEMIASSGREIVVEGVETQERFDLLVESGRVSFAQGYLISRPLPIEGFRDFLLRHETSDLARCAATKAA